MAIVMNMRWPEATLEQYDQLRELVSWEEDLPPGAIFHVAAHDGQQMRVTDVWESAEDFQSFVDTRLMPAVAQIGVQGQPNIEILAAHAMFNPAGVIDLTGAKTGTARAT
jgi:hypothetical protein